MIIIIIYEEQAWTNRPIDEHAQGRTDFGMNTAWWQVVRITAPVEWYRGYRYFSVEKEYSYALCPSIVYFNIPLLIISTIEILICHREIEVNRC